MSNLTDKLKDAMALWRAEVIARDLHFACIHETGHLVVAQHVGICGRLDFEWNPAGGEAKRFVRGCFQFDRYHPKLTKHVARIIGLAGAIAECLENMPDLLTADIVDCVMDLECLCYGETCPKGTQPSQPATTGVTFEPAL